MLHVLCGPLIVNTDEALLTASRTIPSVLSTLPRVIYLCIQSHKHCDFPIFLVKRLRHGDIKQLALGPTGKKWNVSLNIHTSQPSSQLGDLHKVSRYEYLHREAVSNTHGGWGGFPQVEKAWLVSRC